jgi:hypothetical protein
VSEYGESSWELDAIEPTQLAELVRQAIIARRDPVLWKEAMLHEKAMREQLYEFAEKYEHKDDDEDEQDEYED